MDVMRRLLRRPEDPGPEEERSDPPFLFAKRIDRRRGNRVLNDVYTRTLKGRKWHRIYEVDYRFGDSDKDGLRQLGRTFAFACGDGASDFLHDGDDFVPATIFVGVPDADRCKSCLASDRVWGKGEIKDKSHWEKWS